jgi:SAM-dependent methyltransferase
MPRNDKADYFAKLEEINSRPKPFEFYTTYDLWTDEYTAQQMLSYHLNSNVDLASRNLSFINRSVDWITSHFHVGSGTQIADFGCGPGLYTNSLAKKQAHLTGIDFSQNSLHYAKNQAAKDGLDVDYVLQNYLDYTSDKRFDLIIMIMCDFCVLSPIQRNIMLSKYHSLLKPGGHVLLDVYSLHAFNERKESFGYEPNQLNGFWSQKKYYGFLNVFKYEETKVVLDKYTIIEPNRTRTIYNWLQYYSPEVLRKEFKSHGLMVESLFSDVAGTPFDLESHEYAIVARKEQY